MSIKYPEKLEKLKKGDYMVEGLYGRKYRYLLC